MIITRNSLQQGYDYLKSVFNGFRELEKRDNAGEELVKKYIVLNPVDIKNFKTLVDRGKFAFKLTYIEILLAQEPILANLDNDSKKELIKKCISNYEFIEKMPEEYATFGLLTPALVLGRILDTDTYDGFIKMKLEDLSLGSFVDYTFGGDTTMFLNIINFSKTYLKQLENE